MEDPILTDVNGKILSEKRIELNFPYSFFDRILGEFVIIPESRLKIFLHSVIPAIAIIFIVLFIFMDISITFKRSLAFIAMFFFTPVLTIFGVSLNYFFNKAAREPFIYSFDDNGIHVNAVTHEFSHRWNAISKVKPTRHYLLFFIGPNSAHCIPMNAVKKAGVLSSLLVLSKSKGVKVVTGN